MLDSDEAMVAYLNAALEEKDPQYFVKALGNAARAKGMTAIAADSGLGVKPDSIDTPETG